MIATILTAVALLTQAAPTLDAELLVAHPGLMTGDLEQQRQDVLAALEEDPASPFAISAAKLLGELSVDGESSTGTPAVIARYVELAKRIPDAEASFQLRRLAKRDARRLVFHPEAAELDGILGDDLFGEFVRAWYVVGPLGPMHGPAPELEPDPDRSPAHAPLANEYRGGDGRPRQWTRVERGPHTSSIQPNEPAYPRGGQCYALAFLDVPEDAIDEEGCATLEVRTSGVARVWWNGVLCIDERRLAPAPTGARMLARVPVNEGWNELLVRIPAQQSEQLSARVLTADGRAVNAQDLATGDVASVSWSVGGTCTPLVNPLTDASHPMFTGTPFDAALRALNLRLSERPDRALTVAAPEDDVGLAAWRLEQLRSLEEARHFPAEMQRRRKSELVDALEEAGTFFAFARAARVRRLIDEDRPADALAECDACIAAAPGRAWPLYIRTFALARLDRRGFLRRQGLERVIESFPMHRAAREALVEIERKRGDSVRTVERALDALEGRNGALPDGSNETCLDALLASLAGLDTPVQAQLLERALEHERLFPSSDRARRIVDRLLAHLRDRETMLARAEKRAEALPDQPASQWEVARRRLALDDPEGAVEALLQELAFNPSDRTTRRLLWELGVKDQAERFFHEFGHDENAALEAATDVRGTSVVEALDGGMIYYFPNGASHTRSKTLSIPLDREGTESLHSIPVDEHTQRIAIRSKSGETLEPVAVGEEWVLPSLAAGDVVEREWDSFAPGSWSGPPATTSWRFASFERAFPTSRWVLFVPNGLDASFVVDHFDGTHEEIEWENGVVHVFESSYDRQIAEPWIPSYAELLPLATFGRDRERPLMLDGWRRYAAESSWLPADVREEVQEFVDEHRVEGDLAATARAIYDALEERQRTYDGPEHATGSWLMERGWPLFLLSAMYEMADIPYEWAVLDRGVSPELDADPIAAFEGIRQMSRIVLRLGVEDEAGDPVWIVPGGATGTPYGALAANLTGAVAYVLEPEGKHRVEALPRTQETSHRDEQIEMTFTVEADGSAALRGEYINATPRGEVMLRQIKEASEQQREASARRFAAQMAQESDVQDARFVLDGSKGPGLVLVFEGRHPTFANGGSARLPFLNLGLTERYGPAERRWPLAVRVPQTIRVVIEVNPGEAWTLGEGPRPIREARDGLEVGLAVEEQDGGARRYIQSFDQRSLVLSAVDVPAFLARMGEVAAEFDRAVQLSGGDGR